jgi:chaperonin cofactor prefoldin
MTIKELLAKLEKHEEICTVKLENIKERLDDGKEKFDFLQKSIWGLYGIIITITVGASFTLAQFIS